MKPDGKILLRQRHDYTASRPKLIMDKTGLIQVFGGKRKANFDDIPSPEKINEVENQKTTVLPVNNSGELQSGSTE